MRGRPNQIHPRMAPDESDGWERRLRTDGLDALGDRREEAIREYGRLLEHLRNNADRHPDDAELYRRAVESVSVEELTHFDLMRLARDLDAPITTADSLFINIATRRRMKQLGPVPENPLGVTKDFDQIFADAFDLRVPELMYAGPLSDVPAELRRNTVLKPERSSDSRGVFYLFGENRIKSVQHSTTIPNWSQMVVAIEQELGPDFVHEERWQIQELIVEDAEATPARDLKFYSFYGEIGMIIEAARHDKRYYEFFDPDGTVADCGRSFEPRFEDPSLTITDKGGVSETMLREVRELSRQIPVPYMRIDYLNGIDGLVFNELSSAPGRSHSWSDEYDRRLGKMYHEAQIRLLRDLLDGKEFARYHEFRRLHRDAGGRATRSLGVPDRSAHRRGRPDRPIGFDARQAQHWDRVLDESGLDSLLDDRAHSLRRHRMLLEHLRRGVGRSDVGTGLYLRAIDAASIDDLTHVDLVTVGRTLKADLTTADSFFRAIALRRRKKQLGALPERFLGVEPETDRRFAAALGVRVVETLRPGAHDHVLTEPRDEEVRESAVGLDGASAREVTFYTFYGEIGLIRETSGDGTSRCEYFDLDGSIANCGRLHEPRLDAAAGESPRRSDVSDARLDPVRALSREIPAPFMCFDYLDGSDGLTFVRMSSAPGMAHTFTDEYDRRLGRMYSEAEIRLSNDLLARVPFTRYRRFDPKSNRRPGRRWTIRVPRPDDLARHVRRFLRRSHSD